MQATMNKVKNPSLTQSGQWFENHSKWI